MSRPRCCPDCNLVLPHPSDPLGPHKCQYPELVAQLERAGVVLDDRDHRMLRWWAGFADWSTREWWDSIIERVSRGNR